MATEGERKIQIEVEETLRSFLASLTEVMAAGMGYASPEVRAEFESIRARAEQLEGMPTLEALSELTTAFEAAVSKIDHGGCST